MMFFLTAVLSLPAPSTQLTCKTLLAEGTNLNDSDKYCVDLPTEEACGTLNYVFIAGTYRQCGWQDGQCLAKYGDLECPTCDTLLATGTNLNDNGMYCVGLTSEEECGTLNYVFLAGKYRQCGWQDGECLAKYGDLVCPPPLTCETLLAEGTNLNDSNQYCVDLPTEEACGTLNYVAIADTYHQCGWRFGQCLAKYGDLECPIAAPPPSCPPPVGCLGYSPGQIISYEDAKACTGKTFSELVDEWTNWSLLYPDAVSDLDGSQCALGQPYPSSGSEVFFLAGVRSGGVVTRSQCDVSQNKFLFFPLFSAGYGIFPEVEPPPGFFRRTYIDPLVNNVNALEFTFDGQPGTIPGGGTGFTYSEPETADLFAYRGESPPGGGLFDFSLSEPPSPVCPTCPADSILPGVAGGYWLLLAPPTPGDHEIKFYSGYEQEFVVGVGPITPQDITYDPLTVVCA